MTKTLTEGERRELHEALYLAEPPAHPVLRYIAHALAIKELKRVGASHFKDMPVSTLVVSGSQSLPTSVRRPSDLDLTISLRSTDRADWEKAGEAMKEFCERIAARFGGNLSELNASNRVQYHRAGEDNGKMQSLLDDGMQRFYITVPIRPEMIYGICRQKENFSLNETDIQTLKDIIEKDPVKQQWKFKQKYLERVQSVRENACLACGGNNEKLKQRYLDQFCGIAPAVGTQPIQVVIAIETKINGLPPLGFFNNRGKLVDTNSPKFKGINYQHPLVETAKKLIAVLEGPDNPNFAKHLFDFYVRTSPKDDILARLNMADRSSKKPIELTPALKSLIILLMSTSANGHKIPNLTYPPSYNMMPEDANKFGSVTDRLRRLYNDGIIAGIPANSDMNQLGKRMIDAHRQAISDTFGRMSQAEQKYTSTWRSGNLPTLEMVAEVAQPFLSMLEQEGHHIDINELHKYTVAETAKARSQSRV